MSKKPSQDDLPWYKEGLFFKCTGCGKCCGGAPGYVWLTDADIQALAAHLNISHDLFIKTYCRQIGKRISLKEKSVTYDCIFLKDKKCTVYPSRPKQCSTYPFWGKNLACKKSWDETSHECEGINAQESDLIPLSTIQKRLAESSLE